MTERDFRVKQGIIVGANAAIGGSITTVDSIQLNLAAGIEDLQVGQLAWSVDDNTASIGLGETSLPLGQKEYIYIKNQSGNTIGKGNVVMFAGTVGNSGRLLGRKAIADGTFPAKYIIGVAAQSIADGEDGFVTTFGKIRQIDTSMFSGGDILYAHPSVPGALSNVAPIAPNNKITVAAVVNSNRNNGEIFVRVSFSERVDELEDVYINNITDGQTIVWSAANSRFEAGKAGDVSNTWVNANDYATYTTLESKINNVAANVAAVVAKGSIVANASISTLLDSYSSDIFRTSKYLVEATTNSEYYVTDLFVTHMSNNAVILEANTLKSPTLGVQLSASTGANVVNVYVLANADVAVKFTRSSIMRDSNDIPELVIEGDLTILSGFEDLNEGRGFIDLN